jgi:hypothetical protein
MQVTTLPDMMLPHVKPTKLNFNLETTLAFLARHATDAQHLDFKTIIKRFIASWSTLHQLRIECADNTLPGTAFAVQDDYGRTCPMNTQRFTDTLEVLARNWQKYQGLSELDLSVLMRKLEITSFAEFDFGEPLLISQLALAAD